MPAQQTPAASHRRNAFIAVALLLVALVIGSVTAVNLFPTRASERSLAAPARPAFAAQVASNRAQQAWSDRLNTLASNRAQQAWSDRLNALVAEAGVLPSGTPTPTPSP